MIEIDQLAKTYTTRQHGDVKALTGVTLNVPDGAIQGIVGPSGAGKSTLLRCLNLLEQPTGGRIVLNGDDLTTLSSADLRAARRRIGTVFQHFELLHSRTVADNIGLPLELAKASDQERRDRIAELVELVGLQGRERSYPSQLSGGQQQRVGIARALAARPDVLLCDEPTSALDPATTSQILDLLVRVNRSLGVTIVLITHELAVVRRICTHAALLDHGRITESGPVVDLVTDAGSALGQLVAPIPSGVAGRPGAALITALDDDADRPWLSELARTHDLDISVVAGGVERIAGRRVGKVVLQFAPDVDRAIVEDYLRRHEQVQLTWLDRLPAPAAPLEEELA
ncbi:methionine ABC transporter ATP-binding protein [Raineyella fluvialis]|uniref:ATP-binding cassette domain-containing protein n=1 Tax=Raineyella fluvialis TaxID=2662261 RepID=A0A5Q2FFE1_9ACTN|nr:methionine ABC transporter ATP-binding protein [Raineyella fluvialis]QGF22996.1 ATP-binding cassette domain-containing protein [Raineyella fluvialis]